MLIIIIYLYITVFKNIRLRLFGLLLFFYKDFFDYTFFLCSLTFKMVTTLRIR